MKKITSLLLSLAMITSLSACGEKEEAKDLHISKEMCTVGEKVVEVVDDYIDLKISYDEAYEKIQHLNSQANSIYDKNQNNDEYWKELGIKTHIISIEWEIVCDSYYELIEARNDLAEDLELETRE